MGNLGPCPYCAGSDVRFSIHPARHLGRALVGSRKRACPACGRRWYAERSAHLPNAARALITGLALASAAALSLLFSGPSRRAPDWERYKSIPVAADHGAPNSLPVLKARSKPQLAGMISIEDEEESKK